MAAIPTFVEHDILCLDAEHGIFYQSFEDFWEQRMEPMQFISRKAEGAFAHLREKLVENAREQFTLFTRDMLLHYPLPAVTNCGGSPQAGELRGFQCFQSPSLDEKSHD